jgi:hypothetical protein
MCAEIPIPNEHQRRLALFNEQAEILLGSRFARAFALTFRMFFRDREGSHSEKWLRSTMLHASRRL